MALAGKVRKGAVSPRELGFFVTVAVAIGLFATSKLGLEITSILGYIHLKASLCQCLSQETALQFHKAAFTMLPCLVKKAAESHSSAKTCFLVLSTLQFISFYENPHANIEMYTFFLQWKFLMRQIQRA